MTFHETILKKLLKYRQTNPNFNFLMRQRTGAGKRFESGHWFQGNDNYAFVGLVNASGGINKTRSAGLLIKPKDDGFECKLQIRFTGESRLELIGAYKEVIKQLGGFVEIDAERFDKDLGKISPDLTGIFKFLDENYKSIISVFKKYGCEDVILSNEEFEVLLRNLNQHRISVSSDEINNNEQNKVEAKVIYAYLKKALSHRKIQREILGEDAPARGGGFLTMKILHKYDIEKDKKGALQENSFQEEFQNAQGKYLEALNLLIRYYPEFKSNTLNDSKMDFQLNTILYGPPGTGKTFKTKSIALHLTGVETINLSREEIQSEFTSKVKEGQIVFTTFHQSMSYEDFIEGIKPVTDDKNISYPVKSGIFKIISEKAEDSFMDTNKGSSMQLAFDEAFQKLKDEWEEDAEIKFPLKTDGYDFTITGFTDKSIQFRKSSGGTGHTLSISTLREGYYNTREIRETGVGIYYPGILKKLKSYQPETNTIQKKPRNFVLIIDEINRGNVSSIFGELITLLEPDKRLGKPEEIKLELPYSKGELFGVPPNLYIIGTMNTADRSVEALDTALRRRFVFEEVMPDPTLLSDITFANFNLQEVLATINNRIEVLLDRDHTIGHSYFIKIKSGDVEELKKVFENNIIPLLQEYFYNDYQKIALVLGPGFVEETSSKDISFPSFKSIDSPEVTPTFQLKKDIDIEIAVQQLLLKFDATA